MKNIITTSAFLCFLFAAGEAKSQVAIGKEDLTNSSVLLEFGTENKGIILPSVADAPGAAGGTFVFNTTDKAVEVWEEREGIPGWTNLTENEVEGIPHSFSNSGTEDVGEGAIIGSDTTTKPGVLVLESTDKALVLPKVSNPHLNILSPVAGTMVYDTDAHMLAVYDGANWAYWK